MPEFLYEAEPRTGGKRVKGVVEQPGEEELRQFLDAEGYALVSCSRLKERSAWEGDIVQLCIPIARLLYPAVRSVNQEQVGLLRKQLACPRHAMISKQHPEHLVLVVWVVSLALVCGIAVYHRPAQIVAAVAIVVSMVLMPLYLLSAFWWWSSASALPRAWKRIRDAFTAFDSRELFWGLYIGFLGMPVLLSLLGILMGWMMVSSWPEYANAFGAKAWMSFSLIAVACCNLAAITGTICVVNLWAACRHAAVDPGGRIRAVLTVFALVGVLAGGSALLSWGMSALIGSISGGHTISPQGRIIVAWCLTLIPNFLLCLWSLRLFHRRHLSWFDAAVSMVSSEP